MEAYKQWVWRNREYVHSLGSLANGLTWLLPEKFSASEIGPEAGVFVILLLLLSWAYLQPSINTSLKLFQPLVPMLDLPGLIRPSFLIPYSSPSLRTWKPLWKWLLNISMETENGTSLLQLKLSRRSLG